MTMISTNRQHKDSYQMPVCKKCYGKSHYCSDCLREAEIITEQSAMRYFKSFDLRMGKELFYHPFTNSYWVKIVPQKADILLGGRGPHNVYILRRNIKSLNKRTYKEFFPLVLPEKDIALHNLLFILDSMRGDEGLLSLYRYKPMVMLFQDDIAISKGMKRILKEVSNKFLIKPKEVTT